MTDTEILAAFTAAHAGDQDAWSLLIEYTHGLMRYWAWQAGWPTNFDDGYLDENDIVASAWVSFFRSGKQHKASDFTTGAKVLSYLKQCVQSTVKDYYRRRRSGRDASGRAVNTEISDLVMSIPDTESVVLSHLAAAEILGRYSVLEQMVLLDIVGGLSAGEAARLRGVPVDSVYVVRTEIRRRGRLAAQKGMI